ncbi:MAG: transporter substrate-binding domain-containing protein [candidate division Zixibacteria bacterium]|nr:transporter substrate-binding domain-containing protein [candidate division Zixibacteria bacterium]
MRYLAHQRLVIWWALGTCLLLFAAGCSNNNMSGMDRIEETGVLRIGTDATYPPFESIETETGDIVGFDIDLVKEVCRELQCSPEFIVTPFDGIVTGLNTGKYDLIVSSFTITPERSEQVAFSDPYYDAGQALAVPEYDTTIAGVDDLAGHSIGVQLGTTGERLAKNLNNVTVVSFENISAAFIDMENGRLDAVINDRPTTEIFIRKRGTAKIVGPTLTAEKYGMAVRKHDRELLEAVNNALYQIRKDSRYQTIQDRWFGPGG